MLLLDVDLFSNCFYMESPRINQVADPGDGDEDEDEDKD